MAEALGVDIRLYRIPEAAALLAVSKDSVYRLISARLLRAVVGPGGRTRVRSSDLRTYIDNLEVVGESIRKRAMQQAAPAGVASTEPRP